ncbi:HTH-type sugar sensing transcriptional regulator TrmB [Halovenus marina]|uniref:HTH-type sugar sensing transcriptional regulator TrmB n=1 Tax=Halovenus marina TaxID=3396621 RepID=UPI003F57B1B0
MVDEEMSERLEAVAARLDFSEYEARAYITILEQGSLTATDLADQADIPQPRIYDTVRNLADSGLVELHESRPMRVVAVDPDQAFADVRETLSELVETLSERFRAPARNSEAVTLISSQQTVRRYLEDVITSAEHELVLSLTPDLLARFESDLAACRDADVRVELLVSPAVDVPDPAEYDYSRVATVARARRGVTTPVVAVADGSYAVYTPHGGVRGDRENYGVVLNRSKLGFLVSAVLNTVVWSSAKQLMDVSGEQQFPRRYGTMRRCVQDLLEVEGTFYATVRGRNVETGEWTTVSGRVVDASVSTNKETAALTLETAEGRIDVGGQLAALEDIEAYDIAIGQDEPPEFDLSRESGSTRRR